MKKLHVFYQGYGEHWLLGTLADTERGTILFEYAPEAIARGLQLSPLNHPLPRPGANVAAFRGDAAFYGLPGFIADALPDGWGLLLMDRALRLRGRDPRGVSVLDRLAMIGDRAMGAFSFMPADDDATAAEVLELKALADDVAALQASTNSDAQLRHLMQLGGSPQGARPKVLVDFNARTGKLASGMALAGRATPWLIKFPGTGEHREVCAIEALYARLARAGGIEIPAHRFFDLGSKHSAFGVERFDRVVRDKIIYRAPIMSLSALLEADHRLPSLDYETLLLATQRLTGDTREVLKAFERCVFNVIFHNRDDHARNFAFRLDEQGLWKLSPAFDLTYSDGPRGEHATSIAGRGREITWADLLRVAKAGGVKVKAADACIAQWCAVAKTMEKEARDLPIRAATLRELTRSVSDSVGRLERV